LVLVIGKAIGAGIKGAKGYKNEQQIKKTLEQTGLGSEQADRVAKKATEYKKTFDDEIKTVKDLSKEQAKEFSDVILGGQSIKKFKYKHMDDALDDYKTMVSRRTAMLEEASLPLEKVKGIDFKIQEATDRLGRKIAEGSQADVSAARKNLQRLKNNKQQILNEHKTLKEKAAEVGIKLMDAQYVGNMADRRYSTDAMITMNDVSRDLTKGLHHAKDLKKASQKVINTLKIKSLKDSEDLIKAVEDGKGPKAFTDLMEGLRLNLNEAYKKDVLAFRENYIPHMTKRTPELMAILEHEIKKTIGKPSKQITLKDIDSIKGNTELMDSLKYLGGYVGKKDKLANDYNIAAFITSMNDPKQLKKLLDSGASAVHERIADKVPDLIREKDMGRILSSWIDSTTADAAMGKNLAKMRSIAGSLKGVDPVLSQYFEGYVNDLSGAKRGFAGISNTVANKYTSKLLQKSLEAKDEGNKIQAGLYEAASAVPQVGQFAQAQLYPYFLGLRPDAVVRNMTQPYMLTIPSISTNPAYAMKLFGRNLHRSVTGLGGQIFNSKTVKALEKKGWLPPDPTPGQFRTLSQGLQKSGVIRKGARGLLDFTNNLAMIGYQQSDLANRIVTYGVGQDLAVDIMKGHKTALKYLQNMPPSYRKKAKEALAAKDYDILEDTVLDHLMATTQFNYNRASMSAYGREMGPFFAQFSKWPTAIGADLFDGYDAAKFSKQKGQTKLPANTIRAGKKYLGPWLMLYAAHHYLQDEQSPQAELLFGKDVSSAAPIESIPQLGDVGRALTPPIASIATEFVTGQGLNNAMGLIPGATWYRGLTERLPKVSGDEGRKPWNAFKEDVLGVEGDIYDELLD